MTSFTTAPKFYFPSDAYTTGVDIAADVPSRIVGTQRVRIKGVARITSAGGNSSSSYWVNVVLRHPDGTLTDHYSQRRIGLGNIAFDIQLPVMVTNSRYIVERVSIITVVNPANGTLPATSSSSRVIRINPGADVRGSLWTNRRPSVEIAGPGSGISVPYNDGGASIISLSWSHTDPDAVTGTSPQNQDRGGYQVQYRPLPTIADQNPPWRQARGRSINVGGYWEGDITASPGLPATFIPIGGSAPANNTLGGLHSDAITASLFWRRTDVQIIAADLVPYTGLGNPQLTTNVPQFRLPPGAWQVRVRTFDMSAHGRTSITAMDPSSISDWSEPVVLYVTASFLPPQLLHPTEDVSIAPSEMRFDWLFRDPRPSGGAQGYRQVRLRRTDAEPMPAPPTPPDGAPPAGTVNLLSNPSVESSFLVAGGWNIIGSTVSRDVVTTSADVMFGNQSIYYQRGDTAQGNVVVQAHQVGATSASFPSVTPGETYNVSVYMKTVSFAGRGRMGVRYRNSSGTQVGSDTWNPTYTTLPSGTYVRVSWSFTVPTGTGITRADVLAECARNAGINAAVGNRVYMDAAQMTPGSALYTYFDGSTPGAWWNGAANLSSSTWGTASEAGNWYEVIPEDLRTSSAQTYAWPTNVLVPGVQYEWQARTYSTPGNFDSGWSDSGFFWAAPEGDTSPVVPDELTEPGAALGCGRNRVFIATRGGETILGEVFDAEQVKWERLRDDISTGSFRAPTGKGCDGLLASLHTWQMEMVVFRDNGNGPQRVWEGPITRITWRSNAVEVEARDPMAYVYRRILRNGFNDAYRKLPNGSIGGLTPVTIRSAQIIRNALGYDDPNVLRYLTVLSTPDDARQSRVIAPYSATAWQVVDDFAARSGLDYTTVGRRIILWDVHNSVGSLPEMGDGDFDSAPIVTEYGMRLANHYGVTNGSGIFGTDTDLTSVGHYGWVEMLSSAYGEDDEAGADVTLTAEAKARLIQTFTDQARRNMQDRRPAPLVVRVPDNSTLNPAADIDINHLVPGVYIPLRSSSTLRDVVQTQKLDRLVVTETAEGEVVQVTLSPSNADDAEGLEGE